MPERVDIWGRVGYGVEVARPPILRPANPERRRHCEFNLELFAETYFAHLYFDPEEYHTRTLKREGEMLLVKEPVVLKYAEAGPRGSGKTTLRIIETIWVLLYRHKRLALWMRKKLQGHEGAEARVKAVKHELLKNDLLYDDFPEVCAWVRSFKGDAQRCRAPYTWSDQELKMPGDRYLLASGSSGSSTGMNVDGIRPDFIIFDDLETERSSKSDAEQASLRGSFGKDFMHLHDINRSAVYIQLGNVRQENSLIGENTDPKRAAGWNGRRYKAINKFPEREDLWDRFIDLFQGKAQATDEELAVPLDECAGARGVSVETFEHMIGEDGDGKRAAVAFYLLNRDEMDRGAELQFPRRLPLLHCYWVIADEGWEIFNTEFQNVAPEDEEQQDRVLEVPFLRTKQAHEPAGIAPAWAKYCILTVDVGMYRLHWELCAWDPDLNTNQMCLAGQQDTNINQAGRYEMTEGARERETLVQAALRNTFEQIRIHVEANGLMQGNRRMVPDLVVTDVGGAAKVSREKSAGWSEVVQKICRDYGPKWVPVKGDVFTESQFKRAKQRNFIREKNNNAYGRVDANVNWYKFQLFEGYTRPAFGENSEPIAGTRLVHNGVTSAYLQHQTAEKMEEVFNAAKPSDKAFATVFKRRTRQEGGHTQNHWFDSGWMQYFAADYLRGRLRTGKVSMEDWFKGRRRG